MFNLNDYETVESRLIKFWKEYPDGRIETELLEANTNRFIITARLFRTEVDAKPWTIGHAEETIAARGVNATSALENCETSAIGRALANAGFATTGKRPSREEMVKVARVENDKKLEAHTEVMAEKPAHIEDVVSALQQTMGASVVDQRPNCKHGEMTPREGFQKSGKPYFGYICTNSSSSLPADKCKAIWYEMDPMTGKFVPPRERAAGES
jgi:hypothetical protein